MLPGGFKKDSRVWLHKNVYQKKAFPSDGYNATLGDDVHNRGTDDHFLAPSPYMTDEFGKVFKKDSRTWLHKSSLKKLAKTMTDGVIRVTPTFGKTKKRQSRGFATKSGGEAGNDLIRTRSSTEMIQKQNVFKVKSKTAALTTEGAPTNILDSVKELSANVSFKQQGASYHQMKTAEQGNCEVSAYVSDFCIVGKKDQTPLITFSSSSDTENEYDKSEDFSHQRDRLTQCEMLPQIPYDSCGQDMHGYDTDQADLNARNGLRELERMLREQSRNRSEMFSFGCLDDALSNQPHDVSPDTLSTASKVSMEACINLSDELGNDTCQLQNSIEQLSQTFECMLAPSPKHLTPPGSTRPSGDG